MTEKKPTYKDLEENLASAGFALIAFIIIAFIIIICFLFLIIIYLGETKINLQAENEQLREQIPVWTLKVRCEGFYDYAYGNINSTIIIQGKGFNDYQRTLKRFQELENCEVIE